MILLHRLYAHQFKQLQEVTIRFPDTGSLLIEGKNEAGKSSLFEAVFFALYGETLVEDRDYRLEDLRGYGAEELVVELDFSIDGRPLSISRRVGKRHTARLRCEDAEGQEQILTLLRDVTARLRMELCLSPMALLNSCFVEQKKLEKLEELDPRDRQACVNELLNLRALTILEEEHKTGSADRQRVQECQDRVRVAGMDAELPGLQEREQRAERRLRYTLLLDARQQVSSLTDLVKAARQEEADLEERFESLNKELVQITAIKARGEALLQMLRYSAPAWQRAVLDRDTAVVRAQELEDLDRELPAREQTLQQARELQRQLQRLLALRREGETLQESIQAIEQQISDRDALQTDWDTGQGRLQELEAARSQQRTAAEAASAAAQERSRDRQRAARLEGFTAQLEKWEQIQDSAHRAEEAALLAEKTAGTLDHRRTQLERLETLHRQINQREALARGLDLIRKTQQDVERRHAGEEARRDRIVALLDRIGDLSQTMQQREQESQAAAAELSQAEIREALERWAEASGRLADLDRIHEGSAGLQARQRAAEDRLHAARIARQSSARGKALAGALAGIVVLAVVFLVHSAGALGLFLLLLLAIPMGLLIRMPGMDARVQESEAQREIVGLEGEARALESRREDLPAQRQSWISRETAARQQLANLGLEAPAGPEAAREAAAAISGLPLEEARAAHQHAVEAKDAAQAELDLDRRKLQAEQSAPAEDLDLLVDRRRTLADEAVRLEEEVCAAQAALGDLEEQGLSLETLPAALGAARTAVAEAVTAQASLPGLQDALERHRLAAQQQFQTVERQASELDLPGIAPPAWKVNVESEQQRLRDLFAAGSEDQIQERERSARTLLAETDRQWTTLETMQTDRRRRLDAISRPGLETELTRLRQEQASNQQEQETLQETPFELERRHLPFEEIPLGNRLALMEDEIGRDRKRIEGISEAKRQRDQLEHDVVRAAQTLCDEWRRSLPEEPTPASPDAALDCLPVLLQAVEQDLSRQDEPGVLERQARTRQDLEETGRRLHTQEHSLRQSEQERRAREVELEAVVNLRPLPEADDLLASFPELAGVGVGKKEKEETDRDLARRNIWQNRSERSALAEIRGIGEEALDLAAERAILAAAQREIQVRDLVRVMVQRTRDAIVNRVMPLTIQNMQRLLPLLTEDRYHQAQWEEKGAITVYDTRARSFQRKRVFSGGARDQISLALRLAFALATLPGEHQRRPGFLFLDEPLSSFDRSRTRALVDLLTRGLLRQQFQQVLLISHSDSFDPEQFDYRIHMDAGRIVESTLPLA